MLKSHFKTELKPERKFDRHFELEIDLKFRLMRRDKEDIQKNLILLHASFSTYLRNHWSSH